MLNKTVIHTSKVLCVFSKYYTGLIKIRNIHTNIHYYLWEMSEEIFSSKIKKISNTKNIEEFAPINEFKFMINFKEESSNGLCINNIFVSEIITNILSYIPAIDVLHLTVVCKNWCDIIKSQKFWMNIYNRSFPNKAKPLPWYVFYCYFATSHFENVIKNGNGQEEYRYWNVIRERGHKFDIEDPPQEADPLPQGIPDFQGLTSCFALIFRACSKVQEICFEKKRLLRYILDKFSPQIYASEWVTGIFDRSCRYTLTIKGYDDEYAETIGLYEMNRMERDMEPLFCKLKDLRSLQWEGEKWEKVEILIEHCPKNLYAIVFISRAWKGHHTIRLAGGVVKIVFDSIQPLEDETEIEEDITVEL